MTPVMTVACWSDVMSEGATARWVHLLGPTKPGSKSANKCEKIKRGALCIESFRNEHIMGHGNLFGWAHCPGRLPAVKGLVILHQRSAITVELSGEGLGFLWNRPLSNVARNQLILFCMPLVHRGALAQAEPHVMINLVE